MAKKSRGKREHGEQIQPQFAPALVPRKMRSVASGHCNLFSHVNVLVVYGVNGNETLAFSAGVCVLDRGIFRSNCAIKRTRATLKIPTDFFHDTKPGADDR